VLLPRRAARTHLVVSSAPSISFAPIAQARLPLDLADRYRLYRLRPGDSPQTLRTPPHGGRPVLRRLPPRLPRLPPLSASRPPAPSEALPPPLATDPAWDGPAGLKPARNTRRPARTIRQSDFPTSSPSLQVSLRLRPPFSRRCGSSLPQWAVARTGGLDLGHPAVHPGSSRTEMLGPPGFLPSLSALVP